MPMDAARIGRRKRDDNDSQCYVDDASAVVLVAAVGAARRRSGAAARETHHRDLQRAVARRLHAAGDQGPASSTRPTASTSPSHERTPDAYTAQFNSGEFKIGGSASLLTVGLADIRGVKVKYLFNLFDFWGAVVTSRPEIKTLKDLEGKQLAGARATTNYVMFEFFAKKLGVDVSKFQVVNTAHAGTGRLCARRPRRRGPDSGSRPTRCCSSKKPDIRTLDLGIEKTWKAFAGGSRIPYLGVGAHADWADANPGTVTKLYATYKAAADWIAKNPEEAAPLIAPGASAEDVKAMAALIRSNEPAGA